MAKGVRRAVRNPEIIRGLRRSGRVAQQHSRGKWKFSKKGDTRKAETVKTAIRSSRVAAKLKKDITKTRFYGADDIRVPLRSNKGKPTTAKLRKSITAGTVLIVLAGRFRGKRVVFLKQLESGLLLVTGPYKINGVPLRRLNQVYTIATSTKVDVSSVDVSKINDAFFARVATKTGKESEQKDGKGFLDKKEKPKNERSAAKKAEQKRVDGLLKPIIAKVPQLDKYLAAKFTLTNSQKPHNMKF